MKKYFLIAFNNLQILDIDYSDLHDYLSSLADDWWHYIPGVYILTSNKDSKYLADKILQRFETLHFFVTEVALEDYNGSNLKVAWDWIAKKKKQSITYKDIKKKDDVRRWPSF